jgi:hypothetical protein
VRLNWWRPRWLCARKRGALQPWGAGGYEDQILPVGDQERKCPLAATKTPNDRSQPNQLRAQIAVAQCFRWLSVDVPGAALPCRVRVSIRRALRHFHSVLPPAVQLRSHPRLNLPARGVWSLLSSVDRQYATGHKAKHKRLHGQTLRGHGPNTAAGIPGPPAPTISDPMRVRGRLRIVYLECPRRTAVPTRSIGLFAQ